MIIVGIDPGKDGGIVAIDKHKIISAMPMLQSYGYIEHIQYLIATHGKDNLQFVIERVSAMPGQGVVSMFTFGYGFGYLIAVLETLGVRLSFVQPQQWKKHFSLSGKKVSRADSKSETITAVRRLYPNAEKVKYHSGIYDAVLIGRYYIDKNNGGDND